jgi:beta-lactamase regulating signal transducer with metallopeptidase domain
MTTMAHAISAALLHFLWQGLLVALVLWLALAILRNRSARLRYGLSCAALAVMTALPFATAWILYSAPLVATAAVGRVVDPGGANATTQPVPASLPAWIAALEAWALPVWFAGVLIFAMRLIWSSRHVVRLQREGDAADPSLIATVSRLARQMNVRHPVAVLMSKLIDSPSVAGWLRPVILLPAATLMNLTVEQLETVLAHELAHIRRHDYLVNLLQNLAETLFFYQPGVWWVSSRIRNERELCCDDVVVEVCGDAIGYARALAKLERLRVASPELAMSSTAGPLLYRIQRLTGAAKEQPATRTPAIVAVCVAFVCLIVNLDWAYAQPPARSEAVVRREAIWVDTVKFGDLPIMLRALGRLTTAGTAELKVPASHANLVQIGQGAAIGLRRGITIEGKVVRVDPVLIQLESPVPEFVSQDVDGVIRIKTLSNVVYAGRPAVSQEGAGGTLFKMEPGGTHAARVKVRFGASSVNSIEIVEGLQPGDRVILSDMAKYEGIERIRLE